MTAGADGLKANQQRALEALAAGLPREAAAAAAGVTARTLRRWLGSGPFVEALRQARRMVYGETLGLLRAVATDAAQALRRLILEPGTPPGALVSACRCVLEGTRAGIELEELLERIEALERTLAKAERR